MSLQLKINYPETLPDAVGKTREQFEQEAKCEANVEAKIKNVDEVMFV